MLMKITRIGGCNVRQKPSTTSTVMEYLVYNEAVEAERTSDPNWYSVKLKQTTDNPLATKVGYVSADCIQPVEEEKRQPAGATGKMPIEKLIIPLLIFGGALLLIRK